MFAVTMYQLSKEQIKEQITKLFGEEPDEKVVEMAVRMRELERTAYEKGFNEGFQTTVNYKEERKKNIAAKIAVAV